MATVSNDLVGPPELQSQLHLCSTQIAAARGTVLFRRGDAAQGLYVIYRGSVSLRLDDECRHYPTRILGPGSIIGLPATIADAPYSLTAEVLEDAELGFVDRASVMECLRTHPDLCLQVMDLLSNEISGIRSALRLAEPGSTRTVDRQFGQEE